MYSYEDFEFLDNAGFSRTFHYIKSAMKYYYNDPDTCCTKFRQALESSVSDIYSIMRHQTPEKLNERIEYLEQIVPDRYLDHTIIYEMHCVRIIGNCYIHNSSNNRDSSKDRLTCYTAMLKIAKWQVDFSNNFCYSDYASSQHEPSGKDKSNKTGKILKTIGTILEILAPVIGVTTAAIVNRKNSD